MQFSLSEDNGYQIGQLWVPRKLVSASNCSVELCKASLGMKGKAKSVDLSNVLSSYTFINPAGNAGIGLVFTGDANAKNGIAFKVVDSDYKAFPLFKKDKVKKSELWEKCLQELNLDQ